MKRLLSIVMAIVGIIPMAFAQSSCLIQYNREALKDYFANVFKDDKSLLSMDDGQRELLIYKIDDFFAAYAKDKAFDLSQKQIAEMQDSVAVLPRLRNDLNELTDILCINQQEIECLKEQVSNLTERYNKLQESAQKLREYRDNGKEIEMLKAQLLEKEELLQKASDERSSALALVKADYGMQLDNAAAQLTDAQSEIMRQKEIIASKEKELAKWRGGVENVLNGVENQCTIAITSSLLDLNPDAFMSTVSSFESMRDYVLAIDNQRVSSIDRQIKKAEQILLVGQTFKDACSYINGPQDDAKSKAWSDKLKKYQSTSNLSSTQSREMAGLITALDNQRPLYRDFRDYLYVLRKMNCLPTKAKIEEQIGEIDKYEASYLYSPEYHKPYADAIRKLKDILHKAANNDSVAAARVEEPESFPLLIDEILGML